MSLVIKDFMDPTMIRYKGVYDWGGLYKLIRKWFDDHKYFYLETKYKDKTSTVIGNELEIKIAPYRRVNEFVKYHITMNVKIWDFKEFEAELNGEKRTLTDGRIRVILHSSVEFDYNNKFNTPFEKKLLKLLVKSIIKHYNEQKHYDNLNYLVYNFQKQIKEYLNMETKAYGYEGWFTG